MVETKILTSFAGGEFSPNLFARVDLEKYNVAAALLRNFFVDFRGGASNRAGTAFGDFAKVDTTVRLIPFIVSTQAAYVIELGDSYARFWSNNAQVINLGIPEEIVTPYTSDELFDIKFVQSADVLTLVHPNHPPANITRLTPSTFAYTVITFGTTVPTPGQPVITISAGGAGGQRYWYVVTAVSDDGREESLASPNQHIDVGGAIDGTGTHVTELTWAASAGASYYNIYRFGPGTATSPDPTVFGLLAQATTITLTDTFGQADFSKNPPEAKDPFSGNNPSVVSYFQQRRVYGSLPANPEELVFSEPGNYDNFNTSLGVLDTDSITISLALREVNYIESMVPMSTGLVVFTTGGAVLVSGGGQGAPITPTNIVADPQASTGANNLPPIVVNNNILFCQSKGSIVRDMTFSFAVQSYYGVDRSALANHLFTGFSLIDWCYAEEPHKLVWVIREDGTALTMAYVPDQEVWGWSRHDTQGLFASTASIPEGNENRVYFVVQRFLNGVWRNCVERLSTRIFDRVEDCWFIDCAVANPQTYPAATLTPGAATGTSLWAASAGVFAAPDVGKAIWAGGGNGIITGFTSATQITVALAADITDLIPYTTIPRPLPSGEWSTSDVISSATVAHLPSQTVSALIDGSAYTGLTTDAGGVVMLPVEGSKVVIGLPFKAQLQTLRLEANPTLQGKLKSIPVVMTRMYQTRGLQIGSTFDALWEIKDAAFGPVVVPAPLITDDINTVIGGFWNYEGQICLQQDYPLPATVLGLIPDYVVGDTER